MELPEGEHHLPGDPQRRPADGLVGQARDLQLVQRAWIGRNEIDDFFAPETDAQAVEPNGVPYPQDDDWAQIDAATKQYDGYKVQAVINELDGYDHSGQNELGVPAILGMNFQTVSVAEKVDSPATITRNPDGPYTVGPTELAGYLPGTTTPGPLLSSALDYVNAQLQRMVDTIHRDSLQSSTAIVITAKQVSRRRIRCC